MGLLDDAIREHLELKRRRGADPGEIAREETEALGPVRREAPTADPAPEDHGSYADHEPAGLDEPGAAYDEDDFGFEAEPAAPAHAEAPAPAVYDDPRDDLVPSEPPATHDAPYAEREDESATPPHGDPYQATREFSATELDEALGQHGAPPAPPAQDTPPAAHDDAAQQDDAVDPEDELEDTPDFLQETPEHDRLWFEQKPPKDFDF